MKTKYYSYDKWEDYQNGLYRQNCEIGKEERIQKAVELFKDEKRLYDSMYYVAFNWKISAESTFTNPSINYQAWLGASCQCYVNKLNDMETIEAWHLLSLEEQQKANEIADKVYLEWLMIYEAKNNFTLFDCEIENENNVK